MKRKEEIDNYEDLYVNGTVEYKVRRIVESLGENVTYLFNNWSQANVNMDKIDGPTVIYILPPSGDLDFNIGEVKDYPQAQIAFVISTEFDFDSEENENLIEQMRRLCVRFILSLNASGWFETIEGRLPYQVVYDMLDDNVTGIIITPTLQETEGLKVCKEQRYFNDKYAIEYGRAD